MALLLWRDRCIVVFWVTNRREIVCGSEREEPVQGDLVRRGVDRENHLLLSRS